MPITPGAKNWRVAAIAGALKHRAEAKSQHQQIEHRLAERGHNLRPRARVAFEFPQPENVNCTHRLPPLHMLANCRIWSAEPALSSRMVEPVSARNASSSDLRAGLLLDRRGRSLGHELAVVDDPDAVRHAVSFVHVVRGQEDGNLLGFVHLLHVSPKLVAALRIKAEGRLVEEENLWACAEIRGRSPSRRFMPPENFFT